MGDRPEESWARRNGGWVAIAAWLIGGWMAILGPGAMPKPPVRIVGPPPTRVMTPGYIARWGNDAACEYLRMLDGGRALQAVERARKAVVRFEVMVPATAERPFTRSSWGSGTLVNGGRHVLVAGHVLKPLEEYPDRKFTVILTDGRTLAARVPGVRGGVEGAPEGDWGLVELEGPPPEGCTSLALGTAADSATVVLLGYSHGWGLDAGGVALPGDTSMHQPARRPLLPLAFVATLFNAESGRADIVAGVQLGGGASGGAVINLEGQLVGVMADSEYSWGTFLDHDEEADSIFGLDRAKKVPGLREMMGFKGTPVGVFRAFLEERWKR